MSEPDTRYVLAPGECYVDADGEVYVAEAAMPLPPGGRVILARYFVACTLCKHGHMWLAPLSPFLGSVALAEQVRQRCIEAGVHNAIVLPLDLTLNPDIAIDAVMIDTLARNAKAERREAGVS